MIVEICAREWWSLWDDGGGQHPAPRLLVPEAAAVSMDRRCQAQRHGTPAPPTCAGSMQTGLPSAAPGSLAASARHSLPSTTLQCALYCALHCLALRTPLRLRCPRTAHSTVHSAALHCAPHSPGAGCRSGRPLWASSRTSPCGRHAPAAQTQWRSRCLGGGGQGVG